MSPGDPFMPSCGSSERQNQNYKKAIHPVNMIRDPLRVSLGPLFWPRLVAKSIMSR
jgi:hypothetical protein